ncbi:MAG TPA: ComEC/Rec2 family competence protein [Solirubrobacterales bacterium]|nr:ComEC/Rec2 family competence protein [Solirubrobacterales bacterium]
MARARPPLPVLLGIALLSLVAIGQSDEIRDRAAVGLGQGMPAREAALARGFVLGEDEDVDAGTKEDFRRAGLSHLLAVSGQNVTLLALLALPLLGALGIPLRQRLLWVLGLIAVYVPVAGAGPSIQRAAVMGALGLLATLAGRRSSRFYALGLAALVTLAIDPGIAGEIGWQLSFAAVLGILVLATPLRAAIEGRIGRGPWRRALADGVAVTIAATLATAPLIAFHFETLSTTTLVANVLALPAVAPAMWLGMLCAGLAQVPGMPLGPLNGINALLLAYIAQVASWCAAPDWSEVHLHLDGSGLILAYLGLAVAILVCRRWPRHVFAIAAAALVLWMPLPAGGDGALAAPQRGLRVRVLDVGQGDAILLQPAGSAAVLVDGGPPGDELRQQLEDSGVEDLGAVVATHDQSDHVGGIEELLGTMPVGRLIFARADREFLGRAVAAGAVPQRVTAGQELRSGGLRLKVLWPPPELLAVPAADPNQLALVIEARWQSFSMLLTADAEAEAVPLDPGPVDVLKVAHHGSDDAGLATLLERTRPQLAVISVGEDNPYGHPTPATLGILELHRVPTLRTDEVGAVTIDVGPRSFRLDG